jgi:undecaprenyl-diphosphatase
MGALDTLLQWDAVARVWLTTHHTPLVDWLMGTLSIIGRGGAIWLALAGLAVLRDRQQARRAARVVLIVVLSYAAIDGILKPMFARARPFDAIADVRVVDRRPTTYSFPSGHASMAAGATIGLMALWPRHRWWLLGLAVAVSFSRIYVGVHYPLDVLVGGCVGSVIGWGVVRWMPDANGISLERS